MSSGISRAVVLASGGLDSTVASAVAARDGYRLHLLTVFYGQRHRIEVERAKQVARALGAEDHRVLEIDLRAIGGSTLTTDEVVPKDRTTAERHHGVPSTYVPARNTIFLSLALAYAETVQASAIYIGANVVDYSGYPDCRPEYLQAFERVARLGTKAGFEGSGIAIKAPLVTLSKMQIINLGLSLGVPFHLTHSCYDPAPNGDACGRCDSCQIRLKGFKEAGIADPIAYVKDVVRT
ncbi:MAG: 7-cyano-7-deazaguanine synthase QueC [Nitrospira sp.]